MATIKDNGVKRISCFFRNQHQKEKEEASSTSDGAFRASIAVTPFSNQRKPLESDDEDLACRSLASLLRPYVPAGNGRRQGGRSSTRSSLSSVGYTTACAETAALTLDDADEEMRMMLIKHEAESRCFLQEIQDLRRKNADLQARLDAALTDMEDKESVAEYSKMIVEAMPSVVDSTYVLRLQSQLCKSLHKMGVMYRQLELVQSRSDETIRNLRDQLDAQSHQLARRRNSQGSEGVEHANAIDHLQQERSYVMRVEMSSPDEKGGGTAVAGKRRNRNLCPEYNSRDSAEHPNEPASPRPA